MTGSPARFWNRRAREDPFFFVDDRLEYRNPDLEVFWRRGEEALEGMLSLLGAELDPSHRALEVGCGLGRMTRALSARCREVLALDVSSEMLRQARELNSELENVSWLVGDGRTLTPVDSKSVDACVSWVVFQHIPDPQVTLGYVEEIARVLRPGGWAAIQVSNDPGTHRRSRRDALRSTALSLLRRRPRGRSHPAWLGSAVDLEELSARAARSGAPVARSWGEGTQYCLVLLRKPATPPEDTAA
jgi:SAM-dependent methyltransferase